MQASTSRTWYVYFLCYPDTEIPFYIGKGTGDRAENHIRYLNSQGDNRRKRQIIQDIIASGQQVLIKKSLPFTDERDAYAYEREMIAKYRDTLVNIRPGGGRIFSDEFHYGYVDEDEEVLPEEVEQIVETEDIKPATPLVVMTAKDVARWLSVHPSMIIRLAEHGEILSFRIGNRWRFRKSDVEDYIEAQRRKVDEQYRKAN
jgi:excisionase family DNA binding protein